MHWLGAEGREQSPGLDDYDDRHHTRGHTHGRRGDHRIGRRQARAERLAADRCDRPIGGTSVETTPGEICRVENREVPISGAGRHKSVSTDKCLLADQDLLIDTLWAACACETWWRGGVR